MRRWHLGVSALTLSPERPVQSGLLAFHRTFFCVLLLPSLHPLPLMPAASAPRAALRARWACLAVCHRHGYAVAVASKPLDGADSRAVSVKAVSASASWLNLLLGAAQASGRFHAAEGRQPVAPGGAAFAAYPQSLRSLRYSTTAKPRLSRQLATPPKPRMKPFGRAPSSLKARRLREAGST